MKELWVEKYRPKTLKEYVVRDEAQRSQIQTWINDKAIPHLFFPISIHIIFFFINYLKIHLYCRLAYRMIFINYNIHEILNICKCLLIIQL